MSWRDLVGLAVRSVRRRPGRTALTVLAVALASTLLCALLVISQTAKTRVLSQLAKGGPLSGIKVAAAEPDPDADPRSDKPGSGQRRQIDDATVARMKKVPGVVRVHPVATLRLGLVTPEELSLPDGRTVKPKSGDRGSRLLSGVIDASAVAIDTSSAADLPVTVVAGRLPAATSRREIAVTPQTAVRLGVAKDDVAAIVGAQIDVGGLQYDDLVLQRFAPAVIVGVVAQEAGPGDVLMSHRQMDDWREWRSSAGYEKATYSGLFVVARDLEEVAPVRARIGDIGYATSAPENLIATVLRYLHVVEIVLSAIGAIALVVAALGICNTMLAAVRERRREIGVLKAIGARDRDVTRLFLIEALVVGVVGGVLGALSGLAVARLVGAVVNRYLTAQGLPGVEAVAPWSVLALVIGGSIVLSALAGAFPARRAARLPAREAVDA